MKKNLTKKKKKIVIIAGIAVAAVIIAVAVIKAGKKGKHDDLQNNQLTIEQVERQTISNYVSMTGKITANDSQTVYSNVNGLEVMAINVEVGQVVKKGDVIAVLDSSDYEDKLETLQKELGIQQAKTALKVNEANRNAGDAMLDALDSAKENQTSVDNAAKDYGYALGDKENAYKDWQDALDDYKDAKEEYEEAESKYKKLKKNKESVKYNGTTYYYDETEDKGKSREDLKNVVQQLENLMDSAEDKATSAERNYNKATESVEKQYRDYDNALEKQADTAEMQQRKIDEANDSVTNAGLDAMTATDSLEDQIKECNKNIEKCTIKAPISGVITSVPMEVGDETDNDNNEICVIQDTSGYKVEGTVDEYDISKIKEGLEAIIKTEATGDEEMKGVVTFVSPTPKSASSGQSSSDSAAAYEVKISLEGIIEDVRIGMTAETNVIIDTAEDVLTVPYDCVVKKSDGSFVIYAVDENRTMDSSEHNDEEYTQKPAAAKKGKRDKAVNTDGSSDGSDNGIELAKRLGKEIVVNKGLEADYYTEISGAGITEGMKVYVPVIIENSNSGMFMMGGPGGF